MGEEDEREKEKGTSVCALPCRLDSGKCGGVPATKIRGCREEKREMGGAAHREEDAKASGVAVLWRAGHWLEMQLGNEGERAAVREIEGARGGGSLRYGDEPGTAEEQKKRRA